MTNDEAIKTLELITEFDVILYSHSTPQYIEALSMAISALKKDVPDIHIGDMVSRQAAIDALKKHKEPKRHNYALFRATVSECEEIIRDLPSVEPEERTKTNACDCVSRQDAISMVHTALFPKIGLAKKVGRSLMQLPSAEPERPIGRWLRSGDDLFPLECDQCGETNERPTPWCPHCGCKMEVENEC